MPLAGLELTVPTSKRPQTHDLDRAAIGIGYVNSYGILNVSDVTGHGHQFLFLDR